MRPQSWLAASLVAGLALVTGCDSCREFKNDPNKYDFYNADGSKGATKEAGPFVIAAYCKGTDPSKVREGIEAALKSSGGGSVGDLKDEGGNFNNFGRWGPFNAELVPVAFETKVKSDLNTSEPLELVWKGTPNERTMELNKVDANKMPVKDAPTVAKIGDKVLIRVPTVNPVDGKQTLISVTKLEQRSEGGYKFKGSLPFTIRSKVKNAEVALEWDGKDDKITPQLEQILFFVVTGFKGDSRDLRCQLMKQEVKTQDGSLLTFDLALESMWFKVTGHSEAAFKIFTATGEITGESGKVDRIEAKLPDGYPQPGKKYETRSALDAAASKDQQPGDYVIETNSDEQAGKVTYALHIRIPVKKDSKDPEEVGFTISVVQAGGGKKDYNQKWTASK